MCEKIVKGCCLATLSFILLFILGLWAWSRAIDVEDMDNREILVKGSALYIYNHYENVTSIEYDHFKVSSFELGSRIYSFDITVNGRHIFSLEGPKFVSERLDAEAEIWAAEVDSEPESALPKKEVPTEMTSLPPSVKVIDKTADK
ncbi:hypothetical protein AB1I63_08045 [Streptococcus pneumoniae]